MQCNKVQKETWRDNNKTAVKLALAKIKYVIHAFFYKNKLYKNTQAEICLKSQEQTKNNHQAEILIKQI